MKDNFLKKFNVQHGQIPLAFKFSDGRIVEFLFSETSTIKVRNNDYYYVRVHIYSL